MTAVLVGVAALVIVLAVLGVIAYREAAPALMADIDRVLEDHK